MPESLWPVLTSIMSTSVSLVPQGFVSCCSQFSCYSIVFILLFRLTLENSIMINANTLMKKLVIARDTFAKWPIHLYYTTSTCNSFSLFGLFTVLAFSITIIGLDFSSDSSELLGTIGFVIKKGLGIYLSSEDFACYASCTVANVKREAFLESCLEGYFDTPNYWS